MLLEDEIVQTVRAAIAALPEDQREVTRLHDLEGITYRNCEQRLNLAQGEARGISRRAHRHLWKNKKLRALTLDQETAYHRHKGVEAFHSSGSSVVEDIVLWRLAHKGALVSKC